MSIQIPIIRTQRLSLVSLQPADAEILYRINQTDGVLRYFPNSTPPPLEHVQRFVADQQSHWENHGFGNWGILPEGEH